MGPFYTAAKVLFGVWVSVDWEVTQLSNLLLSLVSQGSAYVSEYLCPGLVHTF